MNRHKTNCIARHRLFHLTCLRLHCLPVTEAVLPENHIVSQGEAMCQDKKS